MKLLHYTLIFHAFVFLQVFNLINARKLNVNEINVFTNFCNNPIFFAIFLLELVLQWLIVAVGGRFFKTYPLEMNYNLICIGIGATMIPIGFLVRLIPPKWFDCACLQFNEEPMDEEEVEASLLSTLKKSSTMRRRRQTVDVVPS